MLGLMSFLLNRLTKPERYYMTTYEIVNKLIGSIHPVGDTNIDNYRYDNLKEICSLVELLIEGIDKVAYEYKDSKEFSVKRASDYARSFLTNSLGISND